MSKDGMDRLLELARIPGPSGREGAVAAYVESAGRGVTGAHVRRIGDLVVAWRGEPRTAVLAHLDTVGFTLGYGGGLLPLWAPGGEGGGGRGAASGCGGRTAARRAPWCAWRRSGPGSTRRTRDRRVVAGSTPRRWNAAGT